MTITTKDHTRIQERVSTLLAELEELGASSAICSFSCCVGGIGWVAAHFNTGDPLACKGLAEDYLEDGSDDMFFGFGGAPESGEEWPVEG